MSFILCIGFVEEKVVHTHKTDMETHSISVGSVWRPYLLAVCRRPFYVSLLFLRVPFFWPGHSPFIRRMLV